MAINYNRPKIVTDGLVLCLDAGYVQSYSVSGSTLNNRALTGTTASVVNGSWSGDIVSLDGTNDYINVNNS